MNGTIARLHPSIDKHKKTLGKAETIKTQYTNEQCCETQCLEETSNIATSLGETYTPENLDAERKRVLGAMYIYHNMFQ